MNTSICRINPIDGAEKKKYTTEDNIFNSLNNSIIPVTNKQILVPLSINKEIYNKNFRNTLKPINENKNYIPALKHTKFPLQKIFSPRKPNANFIKEKNRLNHILDVANVEKKFDVCLNPNNNTTTMEIFPNKMNQMNYYYNDIRYKSNKSSYNSFVTNLDDGIMNQLFLESNLHSKYTEVDMNSTCSTRDQIENLDYSMSVIEKNRISRNNYQDINIPKKIYQENKNDFHKKQISNNQEDLQNYISDFNKFYSNIKPIINYNTINIIQHKNYSTTPNIYRNGNNEVSKSYEQQINTEEPIFTNQMETFSDINNKTNTNLKNSKSFIIPMENQDMLKMTHSICPKQTNETEILLNKTMSISEMIEQSTKEQLNNMNNQSPTNQSLKKGKKKTMGACFFNLPCFSCQFLMTCNKT